MNSTEILNSLQLSLTIRRLCFQLIENHHDLIREANREVTPWHELNKIERKEFLMTWSK